MRGTSTIVLALTLGLFAESGLGAQTKITLPKNNYTPQQDVEIGLKAAAEVRKEFPIIENAAIARYLTTLGNRLVDAAPRELVQPVYRFSFTPVNLKDINAFALPGGPMFVHRGMVEAARTEGEVVGVMAHELSHVLLRHGTANATKAQNPWLQLGQLAGALGGAIVGGNAGAAISTGSQLGLGGLMLRYSRDFEKQADLLGAQIMARAGYDPRDLAHMFETIANESEEGRPPQWLSSHPDPGNRTAYITKEAESLRVQSRADTGGFQTAKANFASLGPATTMAELERRKETGGGATASTGRPGQPVPPPSSQLRLLNAGVFQANVPSNWTTLSGSNTVRVVPPNGYGPMNGRTVFTHGVEFGVANASSRDLRDATSTWLRAISRDNPDLRAAGDSHSVRLSQRAAIETPLINPSPLGGAERIVVYTLFLSDGHLFYYLSVAPEEDAGTYTQTFARIAQSIRLTDSR